MSSANPRMAARFDALRAAGRAGFIPFITAGDPDYETSLAILKALPGAGADVIELGVPFTDPMADGPAIQEASLRALKAGASLRKTLDLVRNFRTEDSETPIVLMGYYNPVHAYGVESFLRDALEAGVDGLIVVDLPPEEDGELCLPAKAAGIDFIRLATPTTDAQRLPAVLANTSGFLYYVSITGVTGTASADPAALERSVARLRAATALPIAVGFGVKTPEDAAATARHADAVVVGSAIVGRIAAGLENGLGGPDIATDVGEFVRSLSAAVRGAAQAKGQ